MTILEQMIQNYSLNTLEDRKNAIKEIVQEIVLASLSKTDFFKHAAFYGGTALRMFYGINRFSEDLDFSLMTPDQNFSIEKYIPAMIQVVESLGLKFEIECKDKSKESHIKSAFLKGNTKEQFLVFYPGIHSTETMSSNEKIKVKFEIDVEPPLYATTDLKYRLLPFPYQVKVYDKASLFAGKIHAIIGRGWKTRVKGRDLYDFVFYVSTHTAVNLKHLEARLKQTSHLDMDKTLTLDLLKTMLNFRFDEINYQEAKRDVLPFIKDIDSLDVWNAHFFKNITEKITEQK